MLKLSEQVGETPVDDVNKLAQVERGEEIFNDLARRRLASLRAPEA